MHFVLSNIIIYTPWEVLRPASLEIRDGHIVRVTLGKDEKGEDLKEAIVCPGLIETHIHGYGGIDVNSADVDNLLVLAQNLTQHGVTAFIPTVVTDSHENLIKICRTIAQAKSVQKEAFRGAKILGINLEGPYLSHQRAGAQNPEWVRQPNWQEFSEYWEASHETIRIVTIAPELPGALDLISRLASLGICVAIGHTNATYEETRAAIAAGARRATHLFNAMPPIHHRKPGAVIACLESPEVYLEIIFDFIHIVEPMLGLIWKIAGPNRIVAITDAIAGAGLSNGTYRLGNLKIKVEEGIARLADGTLAGSTLCLDQAVRNVTTIGIPFHHALAIASAVPAYSIGNPSLGRIYPGAPADLLVLSEDLQILRTYVDGVLCFTAH